MPTFTPPLEIPGENLAAACAPNDPMRRLWRHYFLPARGLNLLKYTDGTYEITEAWPEVVDGVGQVVDIAYYGAHTYNVSVAEAAALTAAGYGQWLS